MHSNKSGISVPSMSDLSEHLRGGTSEGAIKSHQPPAALPPAETSGKKLFFFLIRGCPVLDLAQIETKGGGGINLN